MPKQNRVTPFGNLIATAHRGTLLGNRGCLHDEQQRIRRLYSGRRWIYCVLQFKGRRQVVMAPRHYTQLFFLDEATALAAGHRPCAECQRDRFRAFRAAWATANPDRAGSLEPSVDVIDAVLHSERLDAARQKVTFDEQLDRLPAGTLIVLPDSEQPFLVLEGMIAAWTPGGYGPPSAKPAATTVRVLTPRSVVRTLAQGFRATVHPTALPSQVASYRLQ